MNQETRSKSRGGALLALSLAGIAAAGLYLRNRRKKQDEEYEAILYAPYSEDPSTLPQQ